MEDVDARPLTLQERSGEAQIFLTRLVSAGNVSAGFASALHVNIYLLALAMMVSNKYLDVGATLQLAVWGTFVLQLFFTLFSSYKHYAIANGDTLPGAVLISVLQEVIQAVETRHAIKVEGSMGNSFANPYVREMKYSNTSSEAITDAQERGWKERYELNGTKVGWMPIPCEEHKATGSTTFFWGMVNSKDYMGDGVVNQLIGGEDWEVGCLAEARSSIVVAIMISCFSTGAVLYLVGKYKGGSLISFVPFPVQCAFLAGCGF